MKGFRWSVCRPVLLEPGLINDDGRDFLYTTVVGKSLGIRCAVRTTTLSWLFALACEGILQQQRVGRYNTRKVQHESIWDSHISRVSCRRRPTAEFGQTACVREVDIMWG